MAGLWEFPNVGGTCTEEQAAEVLSGWNLRAAEWENKLTAKHVFTHVEWHMTGYTLEVSGDGMEEFVWVDREELAAHAVPSAFARYYAEAETRLKELEE